MKKSVLIFIVIAVVWLLFAIIYEYGVRQMICPTACDVIGVDDQGNPILGKCGCELNPSPIYGITMYGGIPFFILILIALILNLKNPETPENP